MLRLKKKLASTATDSRNRDAQSKTSTIGDKRILSLNVSEVLSEKNNTENIVRCKRKVSFTPYELDSDDETVLKRARIDGDDNTLSHKSFPPSGRRLLSLPGDDDQLNPLHCFVRRNIQLFLASKADIDALAPGRKKDIFLNQVGLRCIHCMHLPTQDRVKRAVCYPSSVSRIYHCVSDMKIDHFTQCSEMPPKVKQHFLSLKFICSKRWNKPALRCKTSSNVGGVASTAKYYAESAKALGIVETEQGLFLADMKPQSDYDTPPLRTSQPISPSTSTNSSVSTCVSASSSPSLSSVSSNKERVQLSPESSKIKKHTKTTDNVTLPYSSEKLNPLSENTESVDAESSKDYCRPVLLHHHESHSALMDAARKAGCFFIPYSVRVPKPVVYEKPTLNPFSALQLAIPKMGMPPRAISVPAFNLPVSNVQAVSHLPEPIENNLQTVSHLLEPKERNIQSDTFLASSSKDVPTKKSIRLLAIPEDSLFLNELHCFIRRNIEVFSSTKKDVSVPAPGRKSHVTVGQVGLRCIHCSKLPYKERVKRAVCYPPTVSGVYHSVSNMKFDHFEGCRGFPEDLKKQLLELKSLCNRKRGAQNANCTAKYYSNAAKKMGLVDTPGGIRFCTEGGGKDADRRGSGQEFCNVTENQCNAVELKGLNALLLAIDHSDHETVKWAQSRDDLPSTAKTFPPRKILVESHNSVQLV